MDAALLQPASGGADRLLEARARARASGERFHAEYRLCARDGRVVWVEDEALVVYDEDGDPLHFQGYLLDVTARKLAEDRLRLAESKYRTLAEQLPLVSYILDPRAWVTYVSPQIEQLLGFTPQEAIDDDD